jgi:hypothetical protein
VDVISIGEVEENAAKLEEFVKVVDKDNNRCPLVALLFCDGFPLV